MKNNYNELIISSGGTKGIALVGALNELIKYYPLENIKYYTGCSIGSIICLLLNINYSINELNDIIMKINFENFQELKILNLLEKCGLDEGTKFTNFLKAIIINKNISPTITFEELYEKSNKILTIVVTNITKGIPEYHNYMNTPNMSILLSLRMSSNIPIVFSPIFFKENYYIDGALLDPFPYFYHKNTIKYGICLFDKYEFNFLNNQSVNFINHIDDSFKYIIELIKIMHINYIKKFYKKILKNVIYIDFDFHNININTFEVSIEDKNKMFKIGINKCNSFFNKLFKKRRRKYLSRKYLNIWLDIYKNSKIH